MNSLELFAGAGGLTLGISLAGFIHQGVFDIDENACQTLLLNKSYLFDNISNPPIQKVDVSQFDFGLIKGEIALLAGGPPCQPFSHGGQKGGSEDKRDMFPHFIRAVRELRPQAFLIENVKGLLSKSFAQYFDYIQKQLTYPEIVRQTNSTSIEHLSRLEEYHQKGSHDGLEYDVMFSLLNAANYGVPQRRERVFIVGIRKDLKLSWSFPPPTHSLDALLWEQWVTGEYWERHNIKKPDQITDISKVKELQQRLFPPEHERWLTVRDAISDLPDPMREKTDYIPNHIFVPGAKSYPGHTGSFLDEPAKTLKAGVHGVPGGENMMRLSDDSVRYFTAREAARLQTFPDDYLFQGSWTAIMRQLGNAVPVTLAGAIAQHLQSTLKTVNFQVTFKSLSPTNICLSSAKLFAGFQ